MNAGTFRALLRNLPVIVHATLREIFDESAYARFLQRHHLAASAQSYAEFQRENEISRSRRPRCC